MGYERVPLVTRPGRWPGAATSSTSSRPAIRVLYAWNFFGDTLEELRLFDAESQRPCRAWAR